MTSSPIISWLTLPLLPVELRLLADSRDGTEPGLSARALLLLLAAAEGLWTLSQWASSELQLELCSDIDRPSRVFV